MNVHAFLQHQQNAIDLSNYKHRNRPPVHKNSSPNTDTSSSTTTLTKMELKVDSDSPTSFSNPGLHDFHRENIKKSGTPECPTQQHYLLTYHPSTYYWKPAFPGQGSPPLRPLLVNLCLFYNAGEFIKENTGTASGEARQSLKQHDEGTDLSSGSLGEFSHIKTQTFHLPLHYSTDAEPLNLSLRKRKCSLHFFA